MKRILSILLALALCLGMAAYGSGEPSREPSGALSAESVTQVWTEDRGAVSSYRPAPGVTLAFVPEARIGETKAAVDIYIDGVLYENVIVTNYGELAALRDASGLNVSDWYAVYG